MTLVCDTITWLVCSQNPCTMIWESRASHFHFTDPLNGHAVGQGSLHGIIQMIDFTVINNFYANYVEWQKAIYRPIPPIFHLKLKVSSSKYYTRETWNVLLVKLVRPLSSHSLGLYSLSGKTSYRQISRSLEAARLDLAMIVSLWNLTGTCQISERLEKSKPESRGFETSRDLAVRRLTA